MFKCVKDDTYNIKSWKTAHELNPSEMTKETVDWYATVIYSNMRYMSMISCAFICARNSSYLHDCIVVEYECRKFK